MKKALKRVGLILGVATVAGAVAYAVKKVKEMDDFDVDGVDYDDSLDEDDEDYDEDFCDEDFGDDSDFGSVSDNTYDINGENLTVKEIKDKLLEYYSGEDISDLTEDDLVDLLRSTVSTDDTEAADKASEDSELDTFALINGNTREEVVNILVEANSAQFEKDTLLAMSDGELTQVYADWKVSQNK